MASIPSFNNLSHIRTPVSGPAKLPPQVASPAGPTEVVDFGAGTSQEPALLSKLKFDSPTEQSAPAQESPVKSSPANSSGVGQSSPTKLSSAFADICPTTGKQLDTDSTSGGTGRLQASATGSLAWLDMPVPPDPTPQPMSESFSFADWAHEQMTGQPKKETYVDSNARLFEMDASAPSLDSNLMERHFRGY